MFHTPTGIASRGSTPSRLLGAIALRAAAALCAVATLICGLVLLYLAVDRLYGAVAALASVAGALALITGSLWLAASAMLKKHRHEQELEDARRALAEAEQAALQQDDGPAAPSILGDLGPWLRLLSAGAPVIASVVALVGPTRLIRLAIRGFAAWRAYERVSGAHRDNGRRTPHERTAPR
ncbi:MAG: hypothetical protein AMXMBFR58_30390 [Phycisphaerae bacterium]